MYINIRYVDSLSRVSYVKRWIKNSDLYKTRMSLHLAQKGAQLTLLSSHNCIKQQEQRQFPEAIYSAPRIIRSYSQLVLWEKFYIST